MNEQQWLSSNDPAAMLNQFRGERHRQFKLPQGFEATFRNKLQMFADACAEVCECSHIRKINWREYVKNPHFGWDANCKATAVAPHLLRLIFGNPFRPVELQKSCLSLCVESLAQTCYDLRDPAYFPLIWDALEEAGCTSEEIRRALAWEQRCLVSYVKKLGESEKGCPKCNGTGWLPMPGKPVCVRGFWVTDLILGKE